MRRWNILEQLLLKIHGFTAGETENVWWRQNDNQPALSWAVPAGFILCICLIPVLENGNVLQYSGVKATVFFKEAYL